MTADVAAPRYRLLETLGRGAMGEVCLADDLVLHRQVALKFLTSPGESDVLEQLLAEARAAAGLDHPFICSIYEVTTLDGRPCIAMEFVRGETLERRLRRGPLAVADALHVAEETAEALDAAHRRRVMHRDLKPANVMVTDERHIKVMDFGLAKRLSVDGVNPDALAEAGMLLGTPAYMAPEQIRGETDRRSDIFSFGVMLYELVTGVNPFRRPGLERTLAAILHDPVEPLHTTAATAPAALGAIVSRLLERRPESRYQSFGDVRADLRRVASESAPARSPVVVPVEQPSEQGPPLIGRKSESARLLQTIRDAPSGGAVAVISGEAGAGKTLLAHDALHEARRAGFHTLVGRCHEHTGTPPLNAFIEVLEDAERLLPVSVFKRAIAPNAPELVKLLPQLHRLFPNLQAPLDLPPQLRQRFLFTNIREFLTRSAQTSPLVIFIDDVQWADESTMQLIQHLAQHVRSMPLVIIAAYRDVETAAVASQKAGLHGLLDRVRSARGKASVQQTTRSALNDLIRQGAGYEIALRGFTEGDVGDLLGTMAQTEPPAALVRRFFDQTAGNPLFVAELFRHLNEEGRLFDPQGRWKRDLEFMVADVPESVRVVLERRLERLSDQTRVVLRAAAVIGRRFELDLLEDVVELEQDTVIDALEEGEQARLISGPSGRQEIAWRFPHELVRQTLAGTISQLRRQRLHLRIAEAMARLDPDGGTYVSAIAHHLYSAGALAPPERTANALMRAGDAAHTVYATEEAVTHYRRALEVLGEEAAAAPMRSRVQEHLADLQALIGERPQAVHTLEALARRFQDAGDRVAQARVARKLGSLHWLGGERTQAMAGYKQALQTLDGTGAHVEAAHLYEELGLAAFRSGDNGTALEWSTRALQSAEAAMSESGPVAPDVRKAALAAVAHANNTIGAALARSGQLEEAREHMERSVAVAREQGLLDVACRAYANLGVLYSTVEPRRAIEVSQTGLELASKIVAASLQPYIYANLAAAYCALTDECESEGLDAAEQAVRLDRELGQLDHLAVPLIVIAQIHQCQGELRKAESAYDEALALAEQIGEPQLILPCYDGLATIHLDRGDRGRAAEYMEKARSLCEATGLDPDTLLLLPFLC